MERQREGRNWEYVDEREEVDGRFTAFSDAYKRRQIH